MVAADAEVGRLADLVAAGDVMVLSGAGLSTESGIPDYRGPTGALRKGLPMTYQTFTGDAAARQRYWARSQLGWRLIARAVPNAGHRAVAALQHRGLLSAVVTQNVDGLHQAGGATSVVELHGSLDRVVCLACLERTPRAELDLRLREANPGWAAEATAMNPDGDVALDDTVVATFRLVDCRSCGGLLKPDVVFFGENVPRDVVATAQDHMAAADAMLVVGSSLMVYSGFRFVQAAARAQIPIAAVNLGRTRADDLLTFKVEERCEAALAFLL